MRYYATFAVFALTFYLIALSIGTVATIFPSAFNSFVMVFGSWSYNPAYAVLIAPFIFSIVAAADVWGKLKGEIL